MSGNRPQAFSKESLAQIIGLWDGDPRTLEALGGSNNILFAFKNHKQHLVLRLTRSSYRERSGLEAELDWIEYLAGNGVAVCAPVSSVNERFVESVSNSADELCFASVFTKANGTRINVDEPAIWNDALFTNWGKTLGRIHALSKSFKPRNGFHRPTLDGDALLDLARRILPRSEQSVTKLLETYWVEIGALPKDRDSYGLIHGDLTPGNFKLANGGIVVFDFDDSSYFWYVYDIAVILYVNFLLFQKRAGARSKGDLENFFAHFMLGYQTENKIGRHWISQLPLFLGLFNTLFFISFFQKGNAQPDTDLFAYAKSNLEGKCGWAGLDFLQLCDRTL